MVSSMGSNVSGPRSSSIVLGPWTAASCHLPQSSSIQSDSSNLRVTVRARVEVLTSHAVAAPTTRWTASTTVSMTSAPSGYVHAVLASPTALASTAFKPSASPPLSAQAMPGSRHKTLKPA
eukprot:3590539-Rhodomonas_salina.3